MQVDEYISYNLNRNKLIAKTVRGSGGVGILVKNKLVNRYNITVCTKIKDSILGIKLDSLSEPECIVILCIYIPPESSQYGHENDALFDHLTIEFYQHADADRVILCGDLNARIGCRKDTQLWDNVQDRKVIDQTENKQGERMLTFLNDAKGCVINGRITPELDDYTSVAAHKGHAVVDYCLTRQSDLCAIGNMAVTGVCDIIDELGCEHLISTGSKPPDHSLLRLSMECSEAVVEKLCGNTLGSKQVCQQKCNRRVTDMYMCSELADRMVPRLMAEIRDCTDIQEDANQCYEHLINFILDEADTTSKGRKTLRRSTKPKEYWDEDLSKCWKNMKECEHLFRKESLNGKKREKLGNFKRAQKQFDKLLKNKRRAYCCGQMIKIDECWSKDPNTFWKYIKKLGPKKCDSIPMEVVVDGKVTDDVNIVLNTWKSAFEKLYCSTTDDTFDDVFKVTKMRELNSTSLITTNGSSELLNCNISQEEVMKAVNSAKNNKAVGLDGVPNELLHHELIINLLHCLFDVCLKNNVVPDLWRKAVIHSIPKESVRSLNPLKYRGLALQSCIFKIFCSILNERLVKHLESGELLSDTQNGFRKNRGCSQHTSL